MANNLHTTPQGPGESSSSVLTGASATVSHYNYDRDRLEYELVVRQEPKQARMCGVGGKADRRPIDPPPIVQLRVIDPTKPSTPRRRRSSASGSDTGSSPHTDPTNARDAVSYAQSYLQNPYYFMFASLAKPDDDAELHWLKDGRTRCTTGSVVSSLYHLKDPQNNNEDAGFFVFPDLSVRTEGSYRLKLSLFEVVGNNVRHCKSIYSAPFYVYTAKKFPGMEESTPLSCSLADQGIKIRIRKDIRVRKRPIQALEPLMQPLDGPDERDDDEREADRDGQRPSAKRTRIEDPTESSDGNSLGTPQQWPPVTTIDPNLGPIIPPPSNAQTIPPPSNANSSTTNVVAVAASSAYDARSVYPSYEAQTPLTPQPTQPTSTQTQYRSDPGQLHQASPQQQQIPPPPSQQQYTHHHPPTQHMPPPSHMPPSNGHVTHHTAPPVQQPYAPYPGQTWAAPPPQPQQQMYDPYAHYHHPQHPPHPHYPTMPPPAPTVHMQHAPPHHYTPAMYPQPPAPYPYAGYYEPPPPHPHQNQHPQQYAPVPTNTSSPNNSVQSPAAPPPTAPPSTIPPPVPPAVGYVEYGPNPYGRGTSPQPRGYHPHSHPQPHYGPYPSPHPHPQHQPRHYAPLPPPHPYGYGYGHPHPVPTTDQWGATAAYAPHMPWGDAYSTQQAQSASVPSAAQQPPAPNSTTISAPTSSSMSPNASGLVNAATNHGDRIQLAPLRDAVAAGSAGAAVVADAAPTLAHASGSAGAGTTSTAYLHIHSNGRNGYDTARDRDDRGERDHERLGGRAGKQNPLSIRSIISNN